MAAHAAEAQTVAVAPAASLLVARARAALLRRLDWLATGAPDIAEAERDWAAGRDDHGEEAATRRLAGPEGAAWRRLVGLFGLAGAEVDLLSVAIAVAVDPSLGPLIAAAQGDLGRHAPPEALVRRLFGGGPRPIWRPVSPLACWRLLSSIPPRPVCRHASRATRCWSTGASTPRASTHRLPVAPDPRSSTIRCPSGRSRKPPGVSAGCSKAVRRRGWSSRGGRTAVGSASPPSWPAPWR
jgi:hypothetical protein